MPDKLKELFKQWETNEDVTTATLYQAFQAGFTASAVSMRERAMKVAQNGKASNDVINGIGQLPDIPQ